jgi:ABC-2 type transport system permease protein/lipopolysaccharide transport system permease protein
VTLAQPELAPAASAGQAGKSHAETEHGVVQPASPAGAIQDLWVGLRDFRELWLTVGWYDIRKRYRRSLLGPFWITISLGAFVAALSFVYGPLLGRDLNTYVPWLAFGFIGWHFISDLLNESCNVFSSNAQRIEQLRAPMSLYIYEMVWRNLLILGHNLLIYVFIVVIFPVKPDWATLLVIPGLCLVVVNGIFAAMLLGTLCARFRDIPPIVSMIMRMMLLLTPVLWHPDRLANRAALVDFNPLYYFLEVIRAPLLGNAPPVSIWAVAIALTVIHGAIAIPFFARFNKRIAYWV